MERQLEQEYDDDSAFYFKVCYQKLEQGDKFQIGCSTQLILVILTLVNIVLLSYVIYKECKWPKEYRSHFRITIMGFLISLEVVVFIHYSFNINSLRIYFSVIQNMIYGFAIYIVFYYFIKNSAKLLPGRKKWKITAKVLLAISIVYQTIYLIVSTVKLHKQQQTNDVYNSCGNIIYIAIESSTVIFVVLFLVLGIVIQRQIVNYQPTTQQERAMHEQTKSTATKQLWICIITLLLTSLYDQVYNLVLYYLYKDHKIQSCTNLVSSRFWNQFIWLLSRGIENVFFIYPLLYCFWPCSVTKDAYRALENEESDDEDHVAHVSWDNTQFTGVTQVKITQARFSGEKDKSLLSPVRSSSKLSVNSIDEYD